MPENTVRVCRPTKWGNPWRITFFAGAATAVPASDVHADVWQVANGGARTLVHGDKSAAARVAVQHFRACVPIDVAELRGKNLACWCRLDQPCHADVLLELANAPEATP